MKRMLTALALVAFACQAQATDSQFRDFGNDGWEEHIASRGVNDDERYWSYSFEKDNGEPMTYLNAYESLSLDCDSRGYYSLSLMKFTMIESSDFGTWLDFQEVGWAWLVWDGQAYLRDALDEIKSLAGKKELWVRSRGSQIIMGGDEPNSVFEGIDSVFIMDLTGIDEVLPVFLRNCSLLQKES